MFWNKNLVGALKQFKGIMIVCGIKAAIIDCLGY
jgi:hypothetical protein